jgi:hypothetical protein
VVIEKEEDGEYREHILETTEALFIIVSLPLGKYRFHVIPRNILGQAGEATPWRSFEVPAAVVPDIAAQLPAQTDDSTGHSEPAADNLFVLSEQDESIVHPEPEADEQIAHPEPETSEQIAVTEPESNDLTALSDNEREPETANPEADTRLNTVGASLGTTFTVPLLTITLRGTYAPWRHSFFELGLDVGLVSGDADTSYYSLYPFAHYAYFLPFVQKVSWYAGGGFGVMVSRYSFPEGDLAVNMFAFDFIAGVSLLNMVDISYTLRTSNFQKWNGKLSAGYTYRFK